MKDAVITVRLPKATRRRVERLARAERRSLSQQVEHLIEAAIAGRTGPAIADRDRARPLAGALAGGRVPTLAELRRVRAALSRALGGPGRGHPAR